MPGTPSRQIFGLFTVYRFALALLLACVVREAPHYRVPIPIGWPLVGFVVLCDGVLWVLWRSTDFVTWGWGSLLSLIAPGLDTMIAALVLLEFAYPSTIPILRCFCRSWPLRGGRTGTGLAVSPTSWRGTPATMHVILPEDDGPRGALLGASGLLGRQWSVLLERVGHGMEGPYFYNTKIYWNVNRVTGRTTDMLAPTPARGPRVPTPVY